MRVFRPDLLRGFFHTPLRKNLPDNPDAFRVKIQVQVESEEEQGYIEQNLASLLIERDVFQFLQLTRAKGVDGLGCMWAGMVTPRGTRRVKTSVVDVEHAVGAIRAVVYAKTE